MDEHNLIEQAQRGDIRAFEQLIVRYQRPLFRFLHGFGLRTEWVEELAQETLLKAFLNLKSYRADEGARFATWLFVIAKRLTLNELARREYRQPAIELDAAMSVAHDTTPPPDALAIEQEKQRVLAALQQLKERFRSAVLLSYIEELTLAEIAHIEHCSVGTVKSRIHRGKSSNASILAFEAGTNIR